MERKMESKMEAGLCSSVVTDMEQELQKMGGWLFGGYFKN